MTTTHHFQFTPDHLSGVLGTEDAAWWINQNFQTITKTVAESVPRAYAATIPLLPGVQTWLTSLCQAALKTAGGPAVRRGRSLLLSGATGAGKTHQAYEALRTLARTGAHFRWATTATPDLYALLRPQAGVNSESEYQRVATADLLLLDDLGAGKCSEWVEEVNYRLISHRYDHQLPTIITTNLPPAQLARRLGDRCASRLAGMCDVVMVLGDDRRRSQP